MTERRRRQIRQLALPLIVGGVALSAMDIARRLYRNAQLFCPSPDPEKSWNPEDYGIPRSAVEEHWFETSDGATLYGWYCRSSKPIASALFCHGNRGNLTVSADVIPHLLNAGINVLLFDYRGFGKSRGRVSIDGVVADGVTAAQFHNQIRPTALPSILYGYSLGGAVAAQVIKQHPFDGLILQSTFTSLQEITRVLYPRFPMHLLAGNFFNTLSVVKQLEVPLLVIHGSADEAIPCRMAQEFYDRCKSPKKTIHIVEGGLHKDLYIRDCEPLVRAVNRFAAQLKVKRRPATTPPQPASQASALAAALRKLIRSAAV